MTKNDSISNVESRDELTFGFVVPHVTAGRITVCMSISCMRLLMKLEIVPLGKRVERTMHAYIITIPLRVREG